MVTSVLPTPVGPTKRNEPFGRLGWARLSSPRCRTEQIRGRTWSCPLMLALRYGSRLRSLVRKSGEKVFMVRGLYDQKMVVSKGQIGPVPLSPAFSQHLPYAP